MLVKELEAKTVKQLVQIAGDLGVTGRHSMKKHELLAGILLAQEVKVAIDGEGPEGNDFELNLAKSADHVWEQPVEEIVRITKPKDAYIDSATVGQLVAFRVDETGKCLSGMIKEIHKNDTFLVETKSGVSFMIHRSRIVWVKTGERWPKFVFEAFRKGANDGINTGNSQKSL